MNAENPAPFIQRHPLMTMLLALGVTIVGCLACGILWLYSDTDLERVRAAAQAAGLRLEDNTIRKPASDQSLLDTLDRLTELADSNDLVFAESAYYQELNQTVEGHSFPTGYDLKKGEPIPQYLYDFYAQHMNVSAHDEIMQCIERLKGHHLKDGLRLTAFTDMPHAAGVMNLYTHLCGWMVTLPAEDFRRELRSAYVLLESYPRGSLMEVLVKLVAAGLLCETACQRIEDVPQDLVHQLDILSASLQNNFQLSMYGEFVYIMDVMSASLEEAAAQCGANVIYGELERMEELVLFRYTRERELLLMLDIATHHTDDYKTFRAYLSNEAVRQTIKKPLFSAFLFSCTDPVDRTIDELQILKSIISKTPLPLDAYGNSFKEIHDTTGKLLGCYSIGADGVDNGWDSEEHVMWVYGEL